jgi:ATP-dependent DNA helicase PIF1
LARCDFLKPEEVEQQLDLFEENNKLMKKLCLKKGAIVMCLANLDTDSGICNGSLGIVTDFVVQQFNGDGKSLSGPNIAPRVKFLNGVEMLIFPKLYQHGDYPRLGIQQVPLRLAWAFTIHKSQGVTLDLAQIDLGSNIFEYGQSYVGLSRMRSLDGLYLTGFNPNKIKTNPIVAEFYERIGTITEEMVAKLEERWKPMVSSGGGGTQSGTQSISGGGTSRTDPTTKVVFLG